MKQNRVLLIAAIIVKIGIGALVIIYLWLLGIVVHWHLNPGYYADWYLTNAFRAGLDSFHIRVGGSGSEGMSLMSLDAGMLYWLLFRTGVLTTIYVLILIDLLKIIRSITGIELFYDRNVKIFGRMVVMGIILSCLGVFNIGFMEGNFNFYFSIPFGALLFTAASIVLREIFVEGQKLLEDSKAII